MGSFRLFFAVDVPEETRKELGAATTEIGGIAPHVRPVSRGSFHLTLLFLGDQPEEVLPSLEAIGAQAVAPARSCQVALGPPGFFPRVSFLTLVGEIETLAMVSTVLSDSCRPYMEKPEDRPFKPHITIARLKQNLRPPEKARIVSVLEKFEGRAWTINELVLYKSDLSPKGAAYTALARFPFGG